MYRKILVRTPVGPNSGYGTDGIGMTRALLAAGHDVYLLPTTVTPPIPPELAMLLVRPTEPPFDLTIVHTDPSGLSLTPQERRVTSTAVAWTMYEWVDFSRSPEMATDLEKRLTNFDRVLVYDDISAEALRPYADDRLRKLQGGYQAEDWPPQRREWGGTFRFGMVGALHARKNPWVAMEAFRLLKERHGEDFDAELHLKTIIRSLHPKIEEAYPGVKVHYEAWPQERLLKFYGSLHCLLAPSKGEGKNLPALEAQGTGLPVIGTCYGGHAEWMSTEWSYPVPFETTRGGAEVQAVDLAEVMWHVYSNREEARRKGDLAARTIPPMMDWSKVLHRLEDVIREVPSTTS